MKQNSLDIIRDAIMKNSSLPRELNGNWLGRQGFKGKIMALEQLSNNTVLYWKNRK